jgi:hypothetical protein
MALFNSSQTGAIVESERLVAFDNFCGVRREGDP